MKKIILIFDRYAHYLSCTVLAGLMFLTIIDILGRAFFNHPITGKYELTGLCLVIIVFFSFGYAEHHKDHVVIDFVYEHMPPALQKIVYLFSQIICLAIAGDLLWRMLAYGIHMISPNSITASLKIPNWPIILTACIGLVSFLFSYLYNLFFSKNERGEQINDIN